VGKIVSLLEYRYAKLYREQVALWRSRQIGLPACHQIAAHVCHDEFIGRLKPAVMTSLNRCLCGASPPVVPSDYGMEEAS
jgi:hypothetical protein